MTNENKNYGKQGDSAVSEAGERENLSQLLPEDLEFNLSDFALFLSVMKNKEAYESVLSIIMDEPDLKMKRVEVEQVILNRVGKRAIRLDAWGEDILERQFNTEMQNDTDTDDVRKRARYYQGLIDSPILKSGKRTKYRQLPSTIIIFITQEDVFKRDLAMYTFSEQCEEIEGLKLEDGTRKIFLNMTSKNGRPDLVSMLQYMRRTKLSNPDITVRDDRILKLDSIVEEVRESEEWEAVETSILSYALEKATEKVTAEMIEKGVQVLIETCNELGVSKQDTLAKVKEKYAFGMETTEQYMKKYWKEQ